MLDRFVQRAGRQALDAAAAPDGAWLSNIEQMVGAGTTVLLRLVKDLQAGTLMEPSLQQQLHPRVQRAVRASVLQPQQLVAWMRSMVAATRVLLRLKGECRESLCKAPHSWKPCLAAEQHLAVRLLPVA